MNRIKELRKEKSLTLKELSQKIGLRDSTLSQYETGKVTPRLAYAQKLASFFNVSVSYLLGTSNIKDDLKLERLINEFSEKIQKEELGINNKDFNKLIRKVNNENIKLNKDTNKQVVTGVFNNMVKNIFARSDDDLNELFINFICKLDVLTDKHQKFNDVSDIQQLFMKMINRISNE